MSTREHARNGRHGDGRVKRHEKILSSPSRTYIDVQRNSFASFAIRPPSFLTAPFCFLTEMSPVWSVSTGSSSQPSFSMTLPSPPSFSALAMTSSRRLTAALKLASERT